MTDRVPTIVAAPGRDGRYFVDRGDGWGRGFTLLPEAYAELHRIVTEATDHEKRK